MNKGLKYIPFYEFILYGIPINIELKDLYIKGKRAWKLQCLINIDFILEQNIALLNSF
jgi:hypothetical protein